MISPSSTKGLRARLSRAAMSFSCASRAERVGDDSESADSVVLLLVDPALPVKGLRHERRQHRANPLHLYSRATPARVRRRIAGRRLGDVASLVGGDPGERAPGLHGPCASTVMSLVDAYGRATSTESSGWYVPRS